MDKILKSIFEPIADHGDWEAEYRALLRTCGLTGRPDRAAVRVSGERHREMVDGLVTNQLSDLAGAGRHALLLTAKGRVLTDLKVLPRAGELLLDVPQAGLQNLLVTFTKYLPPIYASFEDVSGSLRQVGLYGPAAVDAAQQALGVTIPEDDLGLAELEFDESLLTLVRARQLAGDGVEIFVPESALRGLVDRLLPAVLQHDGRPVGMRALEVARVEWGVPRYGVDMSEENLAQETGLEERAISFDKGCYVGQEVVARIHFRGHVNRHLRGLRFEDELPRPGAKLVEADKDVGAVTSAVSSPELGPIGLGYVRSRIEPNNVVHWQEDGREGLVTVAELPRGHRLK